MTTISNGITSPVSTGTETVSSGGNEYQATVFHGGQLTVFYWPAGRS